MSIYAVLGLIDVQMPHTERVREKERESYWMLGSATVTAIVACGCLWCLGFVCAAKYATAAGFVHGSQQMN